MLVKFKPGPNKLQVVKILLEELEISLKEARDAVVNDCMFKCTNQSFEKIKEKIEKNGGEIIECS